MSTGKICIIGASSSVAAQLTTSLLQAGESLHLIAKDVSSLPDTPLVSTAAADVTNTAQLQQAIAACPGPLKGLVYCPGTIILKDVASITEQDFNHHLAVNTTGAFFAVQAGLAKLKEGHGSVVLFSSVAARKGFAKHAVISACKAGVEGLTVALAKELSPAVRVNCIAPSLMDTKMSQPIVGNPAVKGALGKAHPLGRLGEASDAASLAAFLLSDQSAWITGQVMGLDGGRSSLD
ncbi:MAG: SDR family NAD(P)-dependent oxidoreductase [Alphaproteobacteria bacterium]